MEKVKPYAIWMKGLDGLEVFARQLDYGSGLKALEDWRITIRTARQMWYEIEGEGLPQAEEVVGETETIGCVFYLSGRIFTANLKAIPLIGGIAVMDEEEYEKGL